MKAVIIPALAAFALALGACQYVRGPQEADAGNPNQTAYVGDSGSVYDRAANPPFTPAAPFYDPQAALSPGPAPAPAPEAPASR